MLGKVSEWVSEGMDGWEMNGGVERENEEMNEEISERMTKWVTD